MNYSDMESAELENLVNQKDGDAICELAERYLNGTKGLSVNLTRARQLFHKGEKMGLPRAYLGLGEMYRQGIYFAKNEKIAREYYKKAGEIYPVVKVKPVIEPESIVDVEPVIDIEPVYEVKAADIARKLNEAERLRTEGNYSAVTSTCQEIVQTIGQIKSGAVTYSGDVNPGKYEAEAYWIMAFSLFNQQDYSGMERYLGQQNVLVNHPWGMYLIAVSHRMTQAPDDILRQDIQRLIAISNNSNLSLDEKGDVCAMIGDLYVGGFGDGNLDPRMEARKYYQEAANCGNHYAKDQL